MPFEQSLLLALIVLNGFFALSELAVMTARRRDLRRLAGDRHGAQVARALSESPERFLSSVQLRITLLGILTGFFGGAALSDAIEPGVAAVLPASGQTSVVACALALTLIFYVSVVVGQLVPKRLALVDPAANACRVAIPMRLSSSVASPVVWLPATSTAAILRPFRISRGTIDQVSEDGIRRLIVEGVECGAIERHEPAPAIFVPAIRAGVVAAVALPRRRGAAGPGRRRVV